MAEQSMDPYLLNTSDNTKIIFNRPKFTVGRSLNNSYVVEDLQISRIHCSFEKLNGVWCMTDQSTNGTFVNQQKVSSKIPRMLSNGDTIKLCDNQEYVFINISGDGLENMDFASVVDDPTNKCTEYVVEVSTSDVNDMEVTGTNNVGTPGAIPSTSTKHVLVTNTSKEHPCCRININIEHMNHTGDTTKNTNTISVLPNVTNIADTNNIKVYEKPQPESRLNGQAESSNNNDALEEELQCVICTELFIKSTTLNCSHSFCKYCIEEWREKSNNCPICRTSIITAVRTIVLDNCIAKVMMSASKDTKDKREELVKSREKPETVPPIVIEAGKELRSRTIPPIEISSEEEEEEENTDDDDNDLALDDDMGVDYSVWDDYGVDIQDYDYNGVPGVYYGGYGSCYSCGERGHWANGCPYR